MDKIIVFDFDKTLTVRDTNFSFFRFIGKNQPFYYARLLLYIALVIARKSNVISNLKLKNLGLYLFIGGKSENEILDLSLQFGKTIKLNNTVANLLMEYQKSENRVIIITASIGSYVRSIYPNVEIIGSSIDFKSKIIKLGIHCYEQNKIKQLSDIGLNRIDTLYTDSISDLPLAKISNNINIVSSNKIIECDSLQYFIKHFNKK